jgi:hypothetical protein
VNDPAALVAIYGVAVIMIINATVPFHIIMVMFGRALDHVAGR